MQFLLAVMGCVAIQKGPLWWSAKHRSHHRHTDEEGDPHSPVRDGFWHGHMGWLFARDHLTVDRCLMKDFAKFPELVWLDRLWMLPGLLFATGCYLALGWGGVVVGYCLPLAILHQLTYMVNSLGHRVGSKRFATGDESRNNPLLAVMTLGEGWHNNHHHTPYSARFGFAWYELDAGYLFIRLLAFFRLVWDVKVPPRELLKSENPNATEVPEFPATT
jgi:stearoyl-CoA desaturase (delta-9 desaturase)